MGKAKCKYEYLYDPPKSTVVCNNCQFKKHCLKYDSLLEDSRDILQESRMACKGID
jgi:hypothetical protein